MRTCRSSRGYSVTYAHRLIVDDSTAPGNCSYQAGTSVPPPVKLIRSGDFARMISHCSFLIGFSALSVVAITASGIAVPSQGERSISLDQFGDSNIESAAGFKPGVAKPLVRDDIIP